MTPTSHKWLSAHVFRHDDLNELVLGAVRPLVAELTAEGLVDRSFYLRHSEGGPHVRIRVRTSADAVGEVQGRILTSVRAYLDSRPSRFPITKQAYAEIAARLTELERRDIDGRLYPSDTVEFIEYPPEHESFGHGDSLDIVEHHFEESSQIAIDTLQLTEKQRLSAAMIITLGALVTLPSGVADDRGRGEAVPPQVSRTRLTAVWNRQAEELVTLAERLRALDTSVSSTVPALRWLRSVRQLHDHLEILHRAGSFESRSANPVAAALERCLHLHMNRMGVSLDQEALLNCLGHRAVNHTR